MQLRNIIPTLLLASTATAQLLTQGNGNLPSCAQSCPVLTDAQSSCNGGNSDSLQAWSCFCQTVWTQSGGALTTMCAGSCTSPSDNTAINTWYTNNCGSDNGASEHGGGSNTNNGGSAPSSSASSAPSGSAASGTTSTNSDEFTQDCVDWWSCHWKWIVMIIVIAIGLLALGFGGRYWKKRHDRKADRISESFNAGVTARGTPMASGRVNDSQISGVGDGRNSPSRTREAFMPYGYGYTRSESRLGSHNNIDRSSPLARGSTPSHDLEKANAGTPEDPNKKSRRVKVRERLMGESEK